MFYLTIGLAKFLTELVAKAKEREIHEKNKEVFHAIHEWNRSDFLCRNYILNSLDKPRVKIAKLLWDSLVEKYKSEDAGYC